MTEIVVMKEEEMTRVTFVEEGLILEETNLIDELVMTIYVFQGEVIKARLLYRLDESGVVNYVAYENLHLILALVRRCETHLRFPI
jgi:hypothetical protein